MSNNNIIKLRTQRLNFDDKVHQNLAKAQLVLRKEEAESKYKNKGIAIVDLHMCRLKNLDQDTFVVDKLAYVLVDASLNYFKSVPSALGACAPDLRSLDLSLNQIVSLEGSRLKLPELRFLNLSRNHIKMLYQSSLSGLSNLVHLDLSNNQLKGLDYLHHLDNLETLNVKSNQIEIVEGLERLKQLKTLIISQNELVDIIRLSSNTNLEILDMSQNRLDDLDEVRDIIFCLTKLKEVKLNHNPIAKQRNYKMRILENDGIIKLDNNRVSKGVRKEWHATQIKDDLDSIVEETTTHYMRWIEMEAKQKQKAINILRRREEAIENAFTEYRQNMESELEECITYIQELANNPSAYDGSYLTSAKGHEEWANYLHQAEEVRKETYKEEITRLQANLDEQITLKSDTEGYVEKLKTLSKHRPSVWREIKERELKYRLHEEIQEEMDHEAFNQERDQARARLMDRAESRNEMLLNSTTQFNVRLREKKDVPMINRVTELIGAKNEPIDDDEEEEDPLVFNGEGEDDEIISSQQPPGSRRHSAVNSSHHSASGASLPLSEKMDLFK